MPKSQWVFSVHHQLRRRPLVVVNLQVRALAVVSQQMKALAALPLYMRVLNALRQGANWEATGSQTR